MISALLATILPTFGVIGIGWFCRRVHVWEKSAVSVLNSYAYYIALPALIFQSIIAADIGERFTREDGLLLIGTLVGHLIIVGIAIIAIHIFTKHHDIRATAPMLLAFGNTAYLGIPYATYAFGPQGTTYAALLSVILVVTILFVSIAILNRADHHRESGSTLHRLLELPFLWAVVLGLAWTLIRLPDLPLALNRLLDILASSAGPTALLGLGTFLFDLKADRIPWRWAIPLGIGKVALPAIATFFILDALGLSGLRLAVGTAMGAVSTAVTAFVLSVEYKIGREITAGTILASTLASLGALSVISWLWIATNVFG